MRSKANGHWFLALSCLVLSGCGGSSQPKLDGQYMLPNGRPVSFQDGRFVAGNAMGDGQYLLDGKTVTIRLLNGTQLVGERLDGDHLRLTLRDGRPIPPLDLIRNTAINAGANRQVPTNAHSKESSTDSPFSPDPRVPLEQYTVLRTQSDARWLEVAFRPDLPTDDELLFKFAPTYMQENDSFKKRDIAAEQLPVLRARLDTMRAQHYYAIPFGPRWPNDPPDLIALSGPVINAYDIARHEFRLGISDTSCWRDLPWISVGAEGPHCALHVSDEIQARALESERAKLTTPLYTKGVLYFCITQPGHGGAPPQAHVMHTQVTVASFADPKVSYEGSF